MATLNDVAREAGVSPMTVSRVMNGSSAVAEKTRKRVLEVVDRLRYQPNLLAKSLSADRMHTIGVAVTGVENPMYSLMVSGIYREAAACGYDVMLACSHDLESTEKSLLNLLNKRVSGLVMLPVEYHAGGREENMRQMGRLSEVFPELMEKYAPVNFPVVSVGRQLQKGTGVRVIADYEAGAALAVACLAEKGHRRIGFLSHSCRQQGIWRERFRGFEREAARRGMEVLPEWIVYSEENVASARLAVEGMLSAERLPTAIYCANDVMAAGACQALAAGGLRIPEDISVIGHDGRDFGEMLYPALTTVAIDPVGIGRETVRALLKLASSGESEGGRSGLETGDVMVKPKLVERESVACVPGSGC